MNLGMLNLSAIEQANGLPAGLLNAVALAESSGNPNAVSPVGAQGLFQFMPATAKQYGINPNDPSQAAQGAGRYLGDLSKQFGGDIPSALAAYNWGPGNLSKKGFANAPAETRNYVAKVTKSLPQYAQAGNVQSDAPNLSMMSTADLQKQLAEMEAPPVSVSGQAAVKDMPVHDASDLGGLTTQELQEQLAALEAKPNLGGNDSAITTAAKNFGAGAAQGYLDEGVAAILTPFMHEPGESYADTYRGLRDDGRLSLKQSEQANPKTALAANIAGNIGGALPGGAVTGLKGALGLGAGLGALNGYGNSESDTLAGDLGQASLGAGIGLVGGAIGAGIGKGAQKLLGSAPARLTADKIRAQASQTYKAAGQAGGVLSPKITDSFIDSASKVLPQTPAGKAVLGETQVTKLLDRMQALKGQPLDLAAAQEIDSGLTAAINSSVDARTGKLLEDGKHLMDIQNSLRSHIANASPADVSGGKAGFDALNAARQQWAQSAKLSDIEAIISRAELSDNSATAIKTGFRTLAGNANRMRGFTKEEAGLIRNAAKTGIVGELLRIPGSRLGPIIGMATGAGFGGTAASEAASLAARGGMTKIQVGKAAKVADAIANRYAPPPPQVPLNPFFTASPVGIGNGLLNLRNK